MLLINFLWAKQDNVALAASLSLKLLFGDLELLRLSEYVAGGDHMCDRLKA
ncbi:MAG: hypothetical protein AAF827_02130 [Cyanobacteria bacterium P01_D01_bin.6]